MKINITSNQTGLFSSFNQVTTWLTEHPEHVYGIDWIYPTNCIYGDYNGQNLWPVFFNDFDLLPDGECHKEWPHYKFTGVDVSKVYDSGEEWRIPLYNTWMQKIKLKEHVRDNIYGDNKLIEILKDTDSIGIHIRNNIHSDEQPHNSIPSINQYIEAIRNTNLKGPIFVASDNSEANDLLTKKFGSRIYYYHISRSHRLSDAELHLTDGNKVRNVFDCIRDVMTLSECKHLIHAVSNMDTAVLYINREIKHTFLVGSKK